MHNTKILSPCCNAKTQVKLVSSTSTRVQFVHQCQQCDGLFIVEVK